MSKVTLIAALAAMPVGAYSQVSVEYGHGKHQACVGDDVEVTWTGYHNIQETQTHACDSADIGTDIVAYYSSGHVQTFTTELQAPVGGIRYFKCDSHCGDENARFEIYCPDSGPLNAAGFQIGSVHSKLSGPPGSQGVRLYQVTKHIVASSDEQNSGQTGFYIEYCQQGEDQGTTGWVDAGATKESCTVTGDESNYYQGASYPNPHMYTLADAQTDETEADNFDGSQSQSSDSGAPSPSDAPAEASSLTAEQQTAVNAYVQARTAASCPGDAAAAQTQAETDVVAEDCIVRNYS